MKITLDFLFHCGSCGRELTREQYREYLYPRSAYLVCLNYGCEESGKMYKYPEIELERIPVEED